MIYRQVGHSDVKLSAIALGGHEFLPDGSSRGFNEDFPAAVQPGYTAPGYGGERRRGVLAAALEHGVNFFDVTIDPENEALGRNLKELSLPYEVYVQTRPQGMGYGYDECNRKMADHGLLRAEVLRLLGLLQRDHIDFLNLPFMQSALDADPDYLEKMRQNIDALKKEGLVRFASADTFSGEKTYLAQIDAGCFDSVDINFNLADAGPRQNVFPAAAKAGMSVVTREVFMKGALFKMGAEAGVTDRNRLARAALKWALAVDEVTSVIVGVHDCAQLQCSLDVADSPELSEDQEALLATLRETQAFKDFAEAKDRAFFGAG